MRWQLNALVLAVLGLIGFGVAFGQNPLQFFGGLANLIGKDTRPDPLSLLRNPDVKKELRLTDDQLPKVDDAVWKALKSTLHEDQYRRLKQIDLQQRDYKAFGDPLVQDELRMTKDQKDDLARIITDSDNVIDGLAKDLQTGVGGITAARGIVAKMQVVRKETKQNCTDVLTSAQRRAWQEMVGDEFKMAMPTFELPDFFKEPKDKGKKKGGKKG